MQGCLQCVFFFGLGTTKASKWDLLVEYTHRLYNRNFDRIKDRIHVVYMFQQLAKQQAEGPGPSAPASSHGFARQLTPATSFGHNFGLLTQAQK